MVHDDSIKHMAAVLGKTVMDQMVAFKAGEALLELNKPCAADLEANRVDPPPVEGVLALRGMLKDPNAEFLFVAQALALDMLQRPLRSGIIILRTGGGKSFLYLLASWWLAQGGLGGRFIAVIVPFKELMNDISARCASYGLIPDRFEHGADASVEGMLVRTKSPLVLISADKFVNSSRVDDFLRTAKSRNRLHCVVMDEAQAIIDPFRHNLSFLPAKLEKLDVPLILNSGSITPSEEITLRRIFSKHFILILIPSSDYLQPLVI